MEQNYNYVQTDLYTPQYVTTNHSHSPQLDKLADALAKSQAAFEPIISNAHAVVQGSNASRNYEYDYITLDKLIKDVTGVLSTNGLSVTGFLSGTDLNLMLLHKSGQWIKSVTQAYKDTDKLHWQGQNLTYKRRQMLMALLNLHAGTDDDGNSADGNLFGKDKNEISQKKGRELTKSAAEGIKAVSFDIVGIKEGAQRDTKIVNEYVRRIKAAGIDFNDVKIDTEKYKSVKEFIQCAPKSTIKSVFELYHLKTKK